MGAFTVCLVAGFLSRLGVSDTYDIGVRLYTDPNCLFWANTFTLLDNGCYANTWAPNASKGFKLTIVYFNAPQRFDIREYTDDCHTLYAPKRELISGTDVCRPFVGSMYAQLEIQFRSNTCQGQ